MDVPGFARSETLFANVAGASALNALAAGCDIALVIAEDGTIEDTAFHDPDLGIYGIDGWVGRAWEDVVTVESVVKIRGLMEESADGQATRRRQVNHAANGYPDLPVDYRLVPVEGTDQRIALGDDLRRMSQMQERLVKAQLDLERDYRRYRESTERYRTVFKMIDRPMIVVDGESGKILDANAAVAVRIGKTIDQLVGSNAARLFERGSRDALAAALNKAFHRGVSVSERLQFSGAEEETVFIDPYRESGQNNLLLRLSSSSAAAAPPIRPNALDITKLDPLPEAVVVTDAKGMIREINSAFLDRVHVLSSERVIGRSLSDWLGVSGVDMQVLMTRVRDEGKVRAFSTVLRDEVGGTADVMVSAGLRAPESGDEDGHVALVITDAASRERGSLKPAEIAQGDSAQFSELVGRVPLKDLVRDAADVIEKLCIEAALRQTKNNRASAADLLGLSRQSLYVKLRRYGLEDFGDGDA